MLSSSPYCVLNLYQITYNTNVYSGSTSPVEFQGFNRGNWRTCSKLRVQKIGCVESISTCAKQFVTISVEPGQMKEVDRGLMKIGADVDDK